MKLVWGVRTYVMGIVNVTPDSFSGDGTPQVDAALQRATQHIEEGADVIDIGGESTRPGHTPIQQEVELRRVLPAIREVKKRFPDAIVSVDTTKALVARRASEAGAEMLNCVKGAPDELLEIAAERSMVFVAMHNQEGTDYGGDVVDEVVRVLDGCAHQAVRRGIPPERVILDPGIGFGKTAEQNLWVMQHLDRIVALGFPTMLGASRKSTLGKLTGRAHPPERVFATAATSALAAAAGVDIVRVHDVSAARDALAVADAVYRNWRPAGWIG